MRVFEPEIKKMGDRPFKVGDRVSHELFGVGFVREVARTAGSNWSIFVEFDNSHERITSKGRFAHIVASFLQKVTDPYEGVDVEFGTNILDINEPVSGE